MLTLLYACLGAQVVFASDLEDECEDACCDDLDCGGIEYCDADLESDDLSYKCSCECKVSIWYYLLFFLFLPLLCIFSACCYWKSTRREYHQLESDVIIIDNGQSYYGATRPVVAVPISSTPPTNTVGGYYPKQSEVPYPAQPVGHYGQASSS
eukprot:Rmarinus@m.24980